MRDPPDAGVTTSTASPRPTLVLVALLAVTATLVVWSSVEFMLVALQVEFRLSPADTMVISQIGPAACLTAVFLAGALADRFGPRSVLTGAGAGFAAGAVVVACSPNPLVLTLGLAIAGIGAIVLAVVGIAVLDRAFPDPAGRARGFGGFALMAPVVSIAIPLGLGLLVPRVGWRPVPVLWCLLALVTAGLARHVLPRVPARRPVELVTPTVAGITCSAAALTASFLAVDARTDAHRIHALIALAATALAVVAFVLVTRRRTGVVDPRWLRSSRAVAVAGTVFLVNSVNLFFLTFLLLQYRYHQTLLATALALVPAQCAAAAGAVLGGRASARMGCRPVATVALLATGALGLGVLLVTATSPAWVPVAVLTVVAVPAAAAVGPVTEAFLDRTTTGGGTGSAWRTSTANLGVAVGGFLVSAVVFAGLEADTERTLGAYREQAAAFRLGGALCSAGAVAAATLVWWSGRRPDRPPGPGGSDGISAART